MSSTVLEVFRQLKDRGLRVIATESRPLNEGHTLASRLSEWGIPATLCGLAAAGLLYVVLSFVIRINSFTPSTG